MFGTPPRAMPHPGQMDFHMVDEPGCELTRERGVCQFELPPMMSHPPNQGTGATFSLPVLFESLDQPSTVTAADGAANGPAQGGRSTGAAKNWVLDREVTVMASDHTFAVRLKELGLNPKSRSGWGKPTESKIGAISISKSRYFECAKKANKGPHPHCNYRAKEVFTAASGIVISQALFITGQHDHRITATQIDPARGLPARYIDKANAIQVSDGGVTPTQTVWVDFMHFETKHEQNMSLRFLNP